MLINRIATNIAIEVSFAPIRDEKQDVTGVVIVFRDVSHSRKLAAQISWQARYDALTGLANRSEFDRKSNNFSIRLGNSRKNTASSIWT